MERNQDESVTFPSQEHVKDFGLIDSSDETIPDRFIYLIRCENVADSAIVPGYGGGPFINNGADSAMNRLLSSPAPPVCVHSDIENCSKSCVRKRGTRYLTQEMFFDILSHLPGQVLHYVMRHVCREWNLMISSPDFIHHHLRNSPRGILIQKPPSDSSGMYVEMRRGCLEMYKFDCGFRGLAWTSCNGLVLAESFESHQRDLYVINPLTKQRAVLHQRSHLIRYLSEFCLAFVEASMEYKVVQPCCSQPSASKPQISVLTIGVDEVWRHIDVGHLCLTSRAALLSSTVITGAFIHWIGSTFVLTFDAETETIRRFPLHPLLNGCRKFLPMGRNLSMVCEAREFFRDVWEMNQKTGTWIKLLSFDLRPLSCKFRDLFPKHLNSMIPYGWLAAREVLLFSTSGSQRCCVAYNLKTGEIQSFELHTEARSYNFRPHSSTLVRLEGGL